MVVAVALLMAVPYGADIWKKAVFYDSSKNDFSLGIYILSKNVR